MVIISEISKISSFIRFLVGGVFGSGLYEKLLSPKNRDRKEEDMDIVHIDINGEENTPLLKKTP
jgi:hypothetical protein